MKQGTPALAPGPIEKGLRAAFIAYVFALVLIPFLCLLGFSLKGGISEFWSELARPTARDALFLTAWTSLLVGAVNLVLGTITAWVLVRYSFWGRGVLSAVVDLPLSIPTLVAGLMLGLLYGPTSFLGARLEALGFPILFARPGIVLALLLVTLPFVVRGVEPVLRELDPAEEEAAIVLGAGPVRTFVTVHLPAVLPAALSGGIRSIGRALGEFGSIVVVAGNIPRETLTAPVYLYGEIESGNPVGAAAMGTALLLGALVLHGSAAFLERRIGARHAHT